MFTTLLTEKLTTLAMGLKAKFPFNKQEVFRLNNYTRSNKAIPFQPNADIEQHLPISITKATTGRYEGS